MEAFVLYLVHGIAALVWIGGMLSILVFFKPASTAVTDDAQRQRLWLRILTRYFAWSWIAIALSLSSGLAMAMRYFGGMAQLPPHVNVMMLLGFLMAGLFAYGSFGPLRALGREVGRDTGAAEKALRRVRILLMVELHVGVAAFVLGVAGKFLA